jgi:uncharacterized membrane protein YfhO
MMHLHLIDCIGICGAVLLLVAYFMATTKRWQTHTFKFQLSNLAAALLLATYNLAKMAYVNVAINVVWASVAIIGLVFIEEHRHRQNKLK